MNFITVDNTNDIPDESRCWTEKWEVEKYHPDAEVCYVYTPADNGSYYYVPTVNSSAG